MRRLSAILLLCSSAVFADGKPASIINQDGAIDSAVVITNQAAMGNILGALGTTIISYKHFRAPRAAAKDDIWRTFRSLTTRRNR